MFEEAKKHLSAAYAVAKCSRDKSNQNGAIIVTNYTSLYGMNRFPDGSEYTEERINERPLKYDYFEHAERAVIFTAAKEGVILRDATMYCPWAACVPCARAIVLSGIRTVFVHRDRMLMTPDRWMDSVQRAHQILRDGNVFVVQVQGYIEGQDDVLVNGSLGLYHKDENVDFTQHMGSF